MSFALPSGRVEGRKQRFFCISIALAAIWLLPADFGSRPAWAQPPRSSPDGLWTATPIAEAVAAANALRDARPSGFRPTDFRLFTLNPNILRGMLQRAPQEPAGDRLAVAAGQSEITLPLPDGSFQRFRIVESSVMSPALAAKFPEIRSFRGQGIDDPAASVRLDTSPAGLHVQILSANGTIIIDPIGAQNQYASFNKRSNRASSVPFECLVQGRPERAALEAQARAARSGQHLRTYRLAVACTGEYAERFGATAADAMAAINTTINRVTGVYEQEAAVRLVLVDNNDQILFTNPATDPFANGAARTLINQSQSVIDARIGDANYDIGHTFSTGAGGLAGLGVVCQTGQKARGVTGRADPFGDPFDVDYVAHEMGHQFGGDHTFNGVSENCSDDNRNGPTAVEPGSGTTIQAYAGICSSDNLQANSDSYFHSVSLDQIIDYTTTGAGNVPAPVPTGNNVPTVDGGADVIVPAATPFRLNAIGADLDGDNLRYCWEQRDLGRAAELNAPDDGRIPLFRSFSPSPDASRVFPQWSDILNQTQTAGERLPRRGRNMKFRVTVRDGRSGVNGDDVVVRVIEAAGPFQVTSPASTVVPSNLISVMWNVAQTDQTPINAQFVNIMLSTDGGRSFSTALSSATPNDGAELVVLPDAAGSSLRLMVESADNAFFAVSPVNFTVQPSRATIYVVRHAERATGSDPDLTVAGAARARTLARLISANRIKAVYSTNTRRTQQTAEPTATANGVTITAYEDIAGLVSPLLALQGGEQMLVVGHSDTVGPILAALGVSQQISIDDEFDNLFVVGLTGGTPTFARFKYSPDPEAETLAALARLPAVAPPAAGAAERREGSGAASSLNYRIARPAAAAAGVAADRFALSNLEVIYLQQNWSPAESVDFYGLRQGSPLLHKEFFDNLEQPDSEELFRESGYLASFGFLPQRRHARNPDGYPVGFVANTALEFTCAACHTSRITHGGKEYRIDGSQAMTDVQTWLAELARALKLTLADAPTDESLAAAGPAGSIVLDQNTKFGRFARRLLGATSPRASQVYGIKRVLAADYARRQRYNDFNDFGRQFQSDAERANAAQHHRYGYGRIDALGAILNQACAEALRVDANAAPANAPVNFPAIWDAPQHDHVQWNGAVDNNAFFGPLGRNTGQVVGVFGLVDVEGDTLVGYDSSVGFDALNRAEELVTKLWSPMWPAAFGRNASLVTAGEAVYRRSCIDCHRLMQRDDPERQANEVLVPIAGPWRTYPPLDTDPLTAKNWNERQAQVGPLAGRYETRPLGRQFPNNANARVFGRDILTHVVFGVIVRSFVPWRDELTLDAAASRAMVFAANAAELMRYKARPLNGVWSTAPYLHNGSVLDMVELLTSPGNRKRTFSVGTTEYNPQTMGFVDDGPFEFDTSKPGNNNAGHAYGVDLSADDKAALIEFLKTL